MAYAPATSQEDFGPPELNAVLRMLLTDDDFGDATSSRSFPSTAPPPEHEADTSPWYQTGQSAPPPGKPGPLRISIAENLFAETSQEASHRPSAKFSAASLNDLGEFFGPPPGLSLGASSSAGRSANDSSESDPKQQADKQSVTMADAIDKDLGQQESPPRYRQVPTPFVANPGTYDLDEEGNFSCPSLGSKGHVSGKCRPCHYVRKPGGCQSGYNCNFCHCRHSKKPRPKITNAEMRKCKGLALNILKCEDKSIEELQVAEALLLSGTSCNVRLAAYATSVLRSLKGGAQMKNEQKVLDIVSKDVCQMRVEVLEGNVPNYVRALGEPDQEEFCWTGEDQQEGDEEAQGGQASGDCATAQRQESGVPGGGSG